MPLNIPANFEKDIQGRDTNLVPVVVIGNMFEGGSQEWNKIAVLSSNVLSMDIFTEHSGASPDQLTVESHTSSPLLLNIPSLKESIDIEKRNYKISSVNLDISNFLHEGKRFSELMSDTSLINTEVRIFWVSPSTTHIIPIDYYNDNLDYWAFQVYFGNIRKYDMTDEKVRLVVEDRSQATFHKDLPLEKNHLGTDHSVPDKYKGKPVPFVYGSIDRSPLVISENYRKFQADSQDVDFIEVDSGYTNALGAGIWLDSLQVDIDGEFYHVERGSQYEYLDNHIGLLPEALSGIVVGTEDTPDSFEEVSLTCRKVAIPKFSISNPRHDSTLISENFLVGYGIDSISAITDGSLDTNNIELLGQRNREYTGSGTGSDSESLLLSINMDVTPQHDTVDGNNKIIGFKINGYNLPKFLDDKVLKANHHEQLHGNTGDTTSISDTYDDYYNIIWRNDCLHSDIINNVFGFITYGNGGDIVPPAGYDNTANQADIKLNFYDVGNPSTNALDMPIILFSGGVVNHFNIQFRTVGGHQWDVDSQSYMRLELTGHIDELGLLVENKAIKIFSKDFYANVKGRKMDGDDSPTSPTIIEDILKTELESDANIDLPDGYSGWRYAFTVDKKINSKKLIENIASSSPYIPRFDNMGNFKFNEIPENGEPVSVDHLHTISEADCIDFSFSRSSINDVKTRIIFRYNWDYARGDFNDSVEADIGLLGYEDDGVTELYKHDYYGFKEIDGDIHAESTLSIEDDRGKYIRKSDNHNTAQDFANWYLMWSCNQKLQLKIKIPLSRGLNLEIGDLVRFGKVANDVFTGELLGGVEPYGIDYTVADYVNGQAVFPNFLITSTNKNLEWVEISCTMMHNLESGYILTEGCLDPNSPDYDEDFDISDNSLCTYPEATVGITSIIINGSSDDEIILEPTLDGNFELTDLVINTQSDIISITSAEITINDTIYPAAITDSDNGVQKLEFIANGYINFFITNSDPVIYNYEFNLTTSEGFNYNLIHSVTYTYYNCSAIGDLNGDGGWNVFDIVILVNCIMAGGAEDSNIGYGKPCNELEYGCAGDMNGDNGWNILDIVQLANCVVYDSCGGD